MVDILSVTADGGLSLADLQNTIRESEAMVGPLVALGNDGGLTIVKYDADLDPPARPVVLVNGGDAQAGATPVCQDAVIIAGNTMVISAFRTA